MHEKLCIVILALLVWAEDFAIPRFTTKIDLNGQTVTTATSGVISQTGAGLNLKLTVDLSDLQTNLTALLRGELDRSDHCGERLSVQQARLSPANPASALTADLYVERWGCVKALGKQIAKKLVAGNARVQAVLTPLVEANSVGLDVQIKTIEADGSLGELLRSDAIRDKIRQTLLNAIQKTSALSQTIPAALHGVVTIRDVHFEDGGSGRLTVVALGEARIEKTELDSVLSQLREKR